MANIVLVGYRGTGKSTVAREIGARLDWAVVAMDAELVQRAGMPIKDLVEHHGWPHFRDLEQALCQELNQLDQRVVDCGGGVVEREANIQALRGAGTVFWLRARPETIVARIAGNRERPSLTGSKSFTDEVVEVLTHRTPLYARLAHVQIDADDATPAQLADRIVELFPRVTLSSP
jgi:shikimate kinase